MGVKITDGFDRGDDEKVVSILKKWRGGVLSDELFATVSGMSPQLSVIIVVYRKNDKNKEILLLKRPNDDPVWPGMLNLPGKMVRNSDFDKDCATPAESALERVQEDELGFDAKDGVKFSGIAYQNTKRGHIVVLVYVAELPMNFKSKADWVWRNVNDLKNHTDMITTEMDVIKVALKSI